VGVPRGGFPEGGPLKWVLPGGSHDGFSRGGSPGGVPQGGPERGFPHVFPRTGRVRGVKLVGFALADGSSGGPFAGASSLGTVSRSPDPFALAVSSASLLRRSWSMSRLICFSAVAGNSAMWALRKTSSSSFMISD
jgi:hypothetical protein